MQETLTRRRAPMAAASEPPPFDLVLYLWQRRRLIIGVTLIGLAAGVAAAFLITPLYRSEVIMFPAITNSASKALLNEQATGRDDILALGDEEDSEQLLQLLHSDEIRDRVAQRFNLFEVYRIKPDSRHRNSELREAYRDHIKFEYTKFSSVKVEVNDPDPQRAADIANFISAQVDSVWKEMARERAEKGLRIVRSKVEQLEADISQWQDSMRVLRDLGVHDYHTQTERYNEYLGAAIVKGDQRAVKEFEERFKVLAQYGGAYVTLQDRLFNETKRLSILRMKLEQAQADLESDLPHKFVVNRAQPADKKSYPIRWLIVAMSGISAFLLALLLIVIQENVNKVRASHGR
ncbi:MAG: Wzz/FepE/Etk N-terminal domain-containing protein [Flavobacteriales bacterium]|nr:MAG: Wzz/FepE/Etk N-terminal domain-containing protein [Flavobacteriales bacterium]